jgi:peptidoglycan/LPS O-acetylase OafA/YrhL
MPEPDLRSGRIPELDGVRGLAIASVLYWHLFGCLHLSSGGLLGRFVARAGSLTWAGVDLFFVLSGFLIGGILLDNRDADNLLSTFYARRAARIFPLYYLWLALFVVARVLLPGKLIWLFGRPLPLWQYATYLQSVGYASRSDWGAAWLDMTWSLAIEEQFYLLLPALVVLLSPRRIAIVAAVGILSAPAVRLAVASHALAPIVLLPARWDSLSFGVLGAWLVRRPGALERMRRRPGVLHAGLFAAVAACVALVAWGDSWGPRVGTLFVFSLTAATSFLVILAALASPWRAPLRARWLGWLGSVAYGVYVFHEGMAGMVFGAFGRWSPQGAPLSDWPLSALSLGLALALAALSYRWLERPFLRWGHARRYRLRVAT